MSDVEIVSADWFRNGDMEADSTRVPYGTYFDDEFYQRDETHGIEGLLEGVTPAVDWRGVGESSVKDVKDAPVKRKPGRPKGSGSKS